MNELDTRLNRLGDTLERAASADLTSAADSAAVADVAPITSARRRRRTRRRIAIAIAVVAVGVPTAAVAATHVFGSDAVANSMPAGTLALAGTEPTCTVVTEDVEFHCVLAHAPEAEFTDWKGAVEPTVDTTKHVNGGCRSLAADGREWECYLGATAVDQKIIGADFLGAFAPGPGRG